MRVWLKKLQYSLLILVILGVSLGNFLLMTTPGLYLVLKLSQFYLPGQLHVSHLHGRLLDKFEFEQLDYQDRDIHITLYNGALNWSFLSLWHKVVPIEQLSAKSIVLRTREAEHHITNLQLKAQLDTHHLTLDHLVCDFLNQHIQLQGQGAVHAPFPISGKLSIDTLKLKLNLSGALNSLQWKGQFHGQTKGTIEGSLSQSQLMQMLQWQNTNSQYPSQGTLKLSGQLPHLTAELSATDTQNQWQLHAKAMGALPWQWDIKANLTHEGFPGGLSAKAMLDDAQHGNLSIEIKPGQYALPQKTLILPVQGGNITMQLTPERLLGKGNITLDHQINLNAKIRLPQFDLSKGLQPAQPLLGQVDLLVNSLDFLKQIYPSLSPAKGQLSASITAQGTVSKLNIASQLKLKEASFSVPNLGLNLDGIDLSLRGKKHQWDATGTLKSANKSLQIKGHGSLNKPFTGNLSLQGENFPLVNTTEYQIQVSPQLTLQLSPTLLQVTGSVLIPFANINPQTLTNSLTLSDDVVFKKEQKSSPPLWFNTQMDVQVSLGKTVELTVKGLHALLEGSLQVKQNANQPVTAKGELSVTKGEYQAFGQTLQVEQGQLIYTGGDVVNPEIHLRATKKIHHEAKATMGSTRVVDLKNNTLDNLHIGTSVKVGAEVSGRLTAPKIQLFSNPAVLSQADILSFIILGTPAAKADKEKGQLLLAALSSMNLGTSTSAIQLLAQLKQNLGFDFALQTNTNYNQNTNQFSDSTAVVVSKSLSKNLTLSYNMDLTKANPNVLTLEYLLNQFFSIQMSSSTNGSGMDVLFNGTKETLHE